MQHSLEKNAADKPATQKLCCHSQNDDDSTQTRMQCKTPDYFTKKQ
jgi:hypothetical protein